MVASREGDRDFKEAIHELSRDPSRSDHLAAATNGLASAYRTLLQEHIPSCPSFPSFHRGCAANADPPRGFHQAANIQRTSYFASTWDRVEQGANQIWQSLHLGEDLVNGARQLNAVALQSPEDFNEIAKRVPFFFFFFSSTLLRSPSCLTWVRSLSCCPCGMEGGCHGDRAGKARTKHP